MVNYGGSAGGNGQGRGQVFPGGGNEGGGGGGSHTLGEAGSYVTGWGGGGAAVLTTEDRLEELMRHVLTGVGMDVNNESIKDTPARFIRMLKSFNQPFDAEALLKRSFQSTDSGSVVSQTQIPFTMLCEHHLMPAWGHAHIAYLPSRGVVVGLSKLARLVQAVGREKPGLQESMNDYIAELLKEHLSPNVMVVIQAEHSCMTCRGACTPGVVTTTSIVKGLFREVPHLRAEAMAFFKLGQ